MTEADGESSGMGKATPGTAGSPLAPDAVVPSLRKVFVILPQVGIVVLGAAYAFGSAFKLSQLHHAGLNFDDTFTRIPLQEILTEGVGTEVIAAAAIPLLAISYVLARKVEDRVSGRAPMPPPLPRPLRPMVRFIPLTGAVGVLLLIPWSFSVLFLLTGVMMTGVTLLRPPPRSAFEVHLWVVALAPIVTIAAYFLFPHPLPTARVITKAGDIVTGPLVTINDGAWIVGNKRPSGFRTVPYSEIVSARATSSGDWSQRRLYRVIESIL